MAALQTDDNGVGPVISQRESSAAHEGTPATAAPAIPGSSGTTRPSRAVPATAWMAGPAPAIPSPIVPAPAVPVPVPAPGPPAVPAPGPLPGTRLLPAARPGTAVLGSSTARTALLLTPDLEERVHHLPLELVRRDIAGDHPGVPLMLRIRLLAEKTGDPIGGAVLDIRHWDALGRTEVRGAQVTDPQGYAEFRTVHPGWQDGVPVHIHAEAHRGGYLAGGRSVAHSGRLHLPEALTAEVAQLPPYRSIRTPRAVNDERACTLHVVPRDRFDLVSGLLASIVVAVSA
ncbi:hypothetical protein [Actinoplanes sp. NPDC023714]|uniref:hypothetical protein n=1 Tax=Actinoplanes sp. NPDC023714 TaxID=3154322 RepID=UPI0034093D2E